MRVRALTISLLLAGASVASAQTAAETNVQVLTRLAAECIAPATEGLNSVALDAPARLPFLRSGLVSTLEADGVTVFEANAAGLPRLSLSLENAGVSYDRAGRGRLGRTVQLALGVRLADTDDRVLHDNQCTPNYQDVVAADALATLENQTYPETRGSIPLSRWKKFVQPVVIAAASAAGTFLFFSLRSKRSDGG